MSHGRPAATPLPDPTIKMTEGWHALHLYYTVDQQSLQQIGPDARAEGREKLRHILDPKGNEAPKRMQISVVSGHKADLCLLMLDEDPLVIDRICHSIRVSPLGTALKPVYSYVSITEVSEYVPTIDQYAEKLRIQEGLDENSASYKAKVSNYEQRLPIMNEQRLYPEFPPFPVFCFYPMSKTRVPHGNWYLESFSSRSSMMAEHATSGIKYAGKVSQLVTASTGFDDLEWGVSLWSRAPEHIHDIVYTMRFDRASAEFAIFGDFYISYIMEPIEAIAHLRL